MLGHSLSPFLIKKGYVVIRHGRKLSDCVANMENYIEVKSVLNSFSPNIIINLAAMTDVDLCEIYPNKAYLSNTHIVENIVRWIFESNSNSQLIQISTDQVYNGVGPHSENDVELKNYYAFSKYTGEVAASIANSIILRTNFIGKSKRRNRESFSDWVVNSLENKQKINVFDDVLFSPLSMKSLVEIIEKIIGDSASGVYNLGSKNGMSKSELAFSLAKSLNLSTEKMRKCKLVESNFKAYRPRDMRLNCSRFESTFGIQLPTLREEIDLLINEYRE